MGSKSITSTKFKSWNYSVIYESLSLNGPVPALMCTFYYLNADKLDLERVN